MLVVDDNATNRRILDWYGKKWGMLVKSSGSPSEALAWVRSGEIFDLALIDLEMPETDGIALGRQLRRNAGNSLRLVLTSSSYGDDLQVTETFDAVLRKPIRQSLLHDAIVGVMKQLHSDAPRAASGFDPTLGSRLPLRILLAEDNVINQKVGLRLLARFGYGADTVADGLEAITAIRERPYDLVLMDMQMPEMDGLESTPAIRALTGIQQPQIVALTANAMAGDRVACLEAGMDDYLSKPFQMAELQAIITRSSARLRASAIGVVAAR